MSFRSGASKSGMKKTDIGDPSNFKHFDHIGLNEHFFENPLDDNLNNFLVENKLDLSLEDDKIKHFVYHFLEKHGDFKKFLDFTLSKAHKHGDLQIVNLIMNCKFLNSTGNEIYTALHLAIRDIDIDIIKYMFENEIFTIVDPEDFKKVIAYSRSLYHKKCIATLGHFQLNSGVQKFLQKMLHEDITKGIREHCACSIDQNYEIDKKGIFGLTALHCAVIRGCTDLCVQLLKKGANCIQYVELPDESILVSADSIFSNALIKLTNHENALTLCIKMQGTLFPCLVELITDEKLNSYDGFGNSLIHLAAKCAQPKLIELLHVTEDKINIANKYGNTPLLELLSNKISQINDLEKIIDVVNILIMLGSDINKTSASGISVFQYASKFQSEKLMLSLVRKNPKSINITKDDFKLVFVNNWFNYCTVLTKILSKEFLSDNITTEIINLAMVNANPSLITLFDNASPEIQHLVLEDILLYFAVDENENLFNYFINIEIAKPKLFENGETLLTNLLHKNKVKFAWKLLRSKNDSVFINLRNSKLQSPLQIAIEVDVLDIVDFLIVETELINEEDEDGLNPIIQLLKRITTCTDVDTENRLMLAIKSIISQGADIFKITSKGQQIIAFCARPSIRNKLEKFYKCQKNKVTEFVSEKIIETDKKICSVCYDREIDCVFECGHTFCTECSKELFVCPFCKSEPTNPKRIYLN